MVIGQVHEFVNKIWLVQITCQRAKLFVGCEAMPVD